MNWWKYGKQGNEEGKLNSLHALILFVTKFGSIFKHGCSLRVLLWYINVHIFPSHFMTFLSDLSAWQLKSAHSTAFSQPCLLFVLLAGYSIIRCKNHHSLGYLMMFVSVHLGESGRSLLQPQQETGEPRGCAVWDGTVQNLKREKSKAKQETGYMNTVCQAQFTKKGHYQRSCQQTILCMDTNYYANYLP